jgi:hypothetical protein
MEELRKLGAQWRDDLIATWRALDLAGRATTLTDRIGNALIVADDILAERFWLWCGLLSGLVALIFLYYAPIIGGNWYRGGNDMIYILPAEKAALPRGWNAAQDWLNGPWIGKELFVYYRPVTSIIWYGLYRAFGENSAPYQALAVALHAVSVAMIACLLRRVFGSPLAALGAALLWGMRHQMAEALEWTPAMTDILAGFFGIGALLVLQRGLDTRRYAILMPVTIGLMVLAMGSKEIALTIPLLAGLLILHHPKLNRGERFFLLLLVGAILVGFFAWRLHCLNGMGFMPGQGVQGRSNASTFTLQKWMEAMVKYLVPAPINPFYGVSVIAAVAGFVVWWFYLFQQSVAGRWIVGIGGAYLLNYLMQYTLFLFDPGPFIMLFAGMVTIALLFFVVWNRPRDAVFLFAYGLIAHIPLYHVVYNAVGNVTYLPETFWAFANAALFATTIDFLRRE